MELCHSSLCRHLPCPKNLHTHRPTPSSSGFSLKGCFQRSAHTVRKPYMSSNSCHCFTVDLLLPVSTEPPSVYFLSFPAKERPAEWLRCRRDKPLTWGWCDTSRPRGHTRVTSAGDNDDIRVLQNVPPLQRRGSITLLQQLLYTQGATPGTALLSLFTMLSSFMFSPQTPWKESFLLRETRPERNSGYTWPPYPFTGRGGEHFLFSAQ